MPIAGQCPPEQEAAEVHTFVADLDESPADLSRAVGALSNAGVSVVDVVGFRDREGLGLRIWCGSAETARQAFAAAHIDFDEIEDTPTPHVELVFDDLIEDVEDLVPA